MGGGRAGRGRSVVERVSKPLWPENISYLNLSIRSHQFHSSIHGSTTSAALPFLHWSRRQRFESAYCSPNVDVGLFLFEQYQDAASLALKTDLIPAFSSFSVLAAYHLPRFRLPSTGPRSSTRTHKLSGIGAINKGSFSLEFQTEPMQRCGDAPFNNAL